MIAAIGIDDVLDLQDPRRIAETGIDNVLDLQNP
jgi:hypothetical protein